MGDNLRSNLYWNTLLRIPSQAIGFAISIAVARILEPSDFGIMAITMMTIGYANLVTNFGFNQAIIQKTIKNSKIINSIFTLDFVISVTLGSVFFFGAEYIAEFFHSQECRNTIKVLCLVFLVTSFEGIPSTILKRDMEFRIVSIFEVSKGLCTSILTLIFAIIGLKYWALVYGQLIPLTLITIALCVRTKWFPTIQYSHRLMRQIYNFGFWNFMKTQLGFLTNHIDKIIIGRYLGTVSLGYYDKSMSIAVIPNESLIMNINSVMFSSFSRNKETKADLQDYFKKSLSLVSIISFPIYAGLIIIAPYFVHVLLGEKWGAMIVPFQIILVGFIFKSFGGLIASLNVGIGKYRNHTLRLLVAMIIFILSCLLLLRFSLVGIAVAFAAYCFVCFTLTLSLSISSIETRWIDVIFSSLSGFLPSLFTVVAVGLLSHYYLTDYSVLNLILLSTIGAAVYFLYLVFDQTAAVKELRAMVLNDTIRKVKA